MFLKRMKNYHNYGPTEQKTELTSKAHQEYLSNPDELTEISNEVSQYFTQPISDTRLVLMEIDPYRVHAYWNVDENDLAHIQKELGKSLKDAQLVLRIYDISYIYYNGTNAHSHFDIEIQGLRNNWYIDLWSSAKSYCADLGFRLPSGDFHAITHSNVIHAPPDSQSPIFGKKGLLVAEDFERIRELDDWNTPLEADAEEVSPPSTRMPPSECEKAIKDYYEKLLGLHEKERTIESKATAEETPIEAFYKEKVAPGLAEREYEAEDEKKKLTKSVYKEEYASTHLVGEKDGLVNNQLSKGTLKEVEAEIHIHGRAKPGSTLNLGGQIITVGSDGMFSIRHPLSHEGVTSLLGTSTNDKRKAENSKPKSRDVAKNKKSKTATRRSK